MVARVRSGGAKEKGRVAQERPLVLGDPIRRPWCDRVKCCGSVVVYSLAVIGVFTVWVWLSQ